MNARRSLVLWALLAALLVVAAACGSASDKEQEHAAPTPAASAARAVGVEPRPDEGHLGPGSIRCSRCHTPEDRKHPKWRETAMALGHDVESRLEDRTTCRCCHLGEVKGFGEPLDRACAECHDDIRVTITKMGSMHCLSCHGKAEGSSTMNIRERAWECKKCHAKDQGNSSAIDVHASLECSDCHRPHQEPWTIPRKCTECHVGHETFHGAAARDADGGAPHAIAPHDAGTFSGEPMACATCHRPHEVGGMASGRCYECHAQRAPETFTERTTFAGGHERCTTCHEPHGGEKAGPRSCQGCHAAIVTMDGRASEPHGKCINCHKPHDVRATPRAACAGCHLSVHPSHPDPSGEGCVGCHNPHPGPRRRAVVPTAGSPALFGAGLGLEAPSPVTCSRCHTKAGNDLGFHAGTTPCKGCHAPHQFTKASAPACSTCHAQQAAAAEHGGHADCKSCHQPHAPKAARPACGSCHEQEAKTAPAGHAACLGCHEAHPSSRAPKATCTSCHASKKSGPHAPVPCASCHRPHGPDAPAGPAGPANKPDCRSCHAAGKLGGLHVVEAHGACASCHQAHAPPSSARATCLACHADRKDHEPTAPVCSGCHGFIKGAKSSTSK